MTGTSTGGKGSLIIYLVFPRETRDDGMVRFRVIFLGLKQAQPGNMESMVPVLINISRERLFSDTLKMVLCDP
jgi:hypothetical protein